MEVLAKMEFEGINLDPDILAIQSAELEKEIEEIQKAIYADAGEEFNIGSPKQLGIVLFEKLQLLEKPKKTKSGQYATGEEILTRLAQEHEIVGKILDYREYNKLKSTYVDALPLLISPMDSHIHTTFSQAVAATGRLSSINPNLQNIPIRTEKGRQVRKAFVPRSDQFVLLSADYSQVELRIMASFSGDQAMIEAFRDGRDIHTTTASRIFGVSLDEVTQDMRRMAKSANFGIIYGISAFGLSQNLNIPRKEAAEIIEAYFKEFPAVKSYMDNSINEAKENEYVTTVLGRRRYLRDINSANATTRGYSERNAINAPIQGSAADLIKIAMIRIQQWLEKEKLQSKMILQVHDELLFDAHVDEVDLLRTQVEKLMRTALELKVPLEVSIGTGDNWLDAH
jgi:DNA polymerase-1